MPRNLKPGVTGPYAIALGPRCYAGVSSTLAGYDFFVVDRSNYLNLFRIALRAERDTEAEGMRGTFVVK